VVPVVDMGTCFDQITPPTTTVNKNNTNSFVWKKMENNNKQQSNTINSTGSMDITQYREQRKNK